MRKNRNWNWQQDAFINGCNEVDLSSWRYLYDFLNRHDYNYPKYLFRGHSRKSYALESDLARALAPLKYDRQKFLENFKLALRGRLNGHSERPLTDKELWIIGQQHGLKTPLMAWTQSPFIATFFAFYPERTIHLPGEDTVVKDFRTASDLLKEPRSLFVLNRQLIEDKRKKFRLDFVRKAYPRVFEKLKQLAGNLVSLNDPHYLDHYIDRILKIGSNVAYNTKLISACETATRNRDYFMVEVLQPLLIDNPRWVSQACLFTLTPTDMTLEEWIQEHFAGTHDEVLIKINLPTDQRDECLNMLQQMNINHLTLCPDINGAARYCNDLLK